MNIIEQIHDLTINNLVGQACYTRNDDGDMDAGLITRVDMFISKHGVGVRLHLKQVAPGTLKMPLCVTLHKYDYNVDTYPVGFLSTWDYAKFYSELG